MSFFDISFWLAFLAGVATFFSPCLLPVLPGFFAFLGENGKHGKSRKMMFISTLLFVMGFLLVFVLLGIGAEMFGKPLAAHRRFFEVVGGFFLLFLGFFLLGFIRIPLLLKERRIPLFFRHSSWGIKNFLFGVTFGFAWTPCIGPILGSILFFATGKESALEGGILLAFFAFGIALPFLLFSLFVPEITHLLQKFRPLVRISKYVIGSFLLFLGAALLFGVLGEISGFFTAQLGTGFIF